MKMLRQKLFFALFGTTEMRNISLNLIEKVLEKENLDGFQYREPDYFKDLRQKLFFTLFGTTEMRNISLNLIKEILEKEEYIKPV